MHDEPTYPSGADIQNRYGRTERGNREVVQQPRPGRARVY